MKTSEQLADLFRRAGWSVPSYRAVQYQAILDGVLEIETAAAKDPSFPLLEIQKAQDIKVKVMPLMRAILRRKTPAKKQDLQIPLC